ncbi:peroxisomal membrane protein LPX1 [Dichotomopilus funicola]|uniref:Peroxisomal membrane protein LPX1 n=1 Tax=Dichotomopilus funicola TaxID=1934379 RepID=A0AAN6UWT9_9PEZI|nr:peroxisomal membrane protein LPX1 [Dichotomopilus funicola]
MPQFFRVVEHTIPCSHSREYLAATRHGDADRPKLAVKQYIPLSNPNPQPGDVTIIGAHANGFPKELYEPLWDDLHQSLAKSGIRIRSVWIADMWNQGQSGVLNEDILGDDPSWWDHTRDLINLLNLKRDEMPSPLVGVGHSMGGAQLTLLAISNPRLLHSLVLLDPVIQNIMSGIEPAAASTFRRDIWDSRSAAAAKFAASRFYKAWDPRVLDLWIQHGLRDLPTALYPDLPAATESSSSNQPTPEPGPPVTLTTTKHQEVYNFLRPTYLPDRDQRDRLESNKPEATRKYNFYRPEPVYAFDRLPELRPSVMYIFGATSEMSTPAARQAKLARTGTGLGGSGGVEKGMVKEVVVDCGHLVAMERAPECAEAAAGFLSGELARWREEQRIFGEASRAKNGKGVLVIDERWKGEVKPKI